MATTKQTTRKSKSHAIELVEFAREQSRVVKSWIELHNAIYGIEGRFGQLFPDQTSRVAFSKSDEFKEISKLIGDLRPDGDPFEPVSGKFNLRLPESMHAALVAEARAEGVSLNQLCVAKLASQLRAVVH